MREEDREVVCLKKQYKVINYRIRSPLKQFIKAILNRFTVRLATCVFNF